MIEIRYHSFGGSSGMPFVKRDKILLMVIGNHEAVSKCLMNIFSCEPWTSPFTHRSNEKQM